MHFSNILQVTYSRIDWQISKMIVNACSFEIMLIFMTSKYSIYPFSFEIIEKSFTFDCLYVTLYFLQILYANWEHASSIRDTNMPGTKDNGGDGIFWLVKLQFILSRTFFDESSGRSFLIFFSAFFFY